MMRAKRLEKLNKQQENKEGGIISLDSGERVFFTG
jgi:hypothetical protein